MPSPVAHWAVGMVVCRLLWPESGGSGKRQSISWAWLVPVSLVLSLLPDAPSVLGLITGDLPRFHNSWEHSLVAGLLSGLLVAGAAWILGLRSAAARWFLIVFLCFTLHVLMDLVTVGRGVKILWPLAESRYAPPVKLFYGLHWSDGWISRRHLWTLLSESLFAGAVVLGAMVWNRRRNRPRLTPGRDRCESA